MANKTPIPGGRHDLREGRYDIDGVRNSLDIVAVVGEYVRLQRVGSAGRYKGLCPFHQEKTPSFSVNQTRQFFNCFGCGMAGDIFEFIMKIEGLTFRKALCTLADRAGIASNLVSPAQFRRQAERRAEIERATLDIRYWRSARIAQLERRKVGAIRIADDVALAEAASELHQLQSDGGAVVALYQAQVRRDPDGVAALIAWARDDEREAQSITAEVVLLLAVAETQNEVQ